MATDTVEAIRQVLARRGDPFAGGADGALDAIASLIGEPPVGSRLVIAHDLPMPVDVIAKHMRRIAENGDWYMVRDPAAQIYELLDRGDLAIFRDDGHVRAHMLGSPVVQAEGDSVEEALYQLWQKTRPEGA